MRPLARLARTSTFRPSSPAEPYFRPSPYRLASNGRSALVAWWGSLWSVGPEGPTEWGVRLQDLIPPHVSEVRLRGRPSAAADALGVPAQASRQEIKRAYREAVMQTHPDLHPDDPTATERFRRVHEAYESLTGRSAGRGNGAAAGVIRFVVASGATVCFLAVVGDDWLVGSGDGRLFRLSSCSRQFSRLRVGLGALFCVRDSAQQVVAVCSYRVAGRSLPEQYPWPDHLIGSYGNYLLAHRPRARDLALIDETGALAVQLRCPRAITSLCVADGALVLAAGALICLEIDGLSPLTRTRIWQPPFARANTEQTAAARAANTR